ncbi:unnamed protein product [Echinostoma caproni]|uniref:Ovule protein n=1 Tax=Echinostoma caproni TaxID=27848 RepID=A0A183AJ48_9TREM|nr:unnamed protein product [Echinostoma caproni]
MDKDAEMMENKLNSGNFRPNKTAASYRAYSGGFQSARPRGSGLDQPYETRKRDMTVARLASESITGTGKV